MTFSKPRFIKNKNEDEWELNRLCTKSDLQILGGASKMFKYFLKHFNPKKVTTYSDCCYFSGEIYKKLGFKFNGYTSIPYYWFNKNDFISREKVQPKILRNKYPALFDLAKQEKQKSVETYIMRKLGYQKVYLVGNKKWIWNS